MEETENQYVQSERSFKQVKRVLARVPALQLRHLRQILYAESMLRRDLM